MTHIIPEVAKSAVLNSLSCPDAQRGYRHAIDDFVDWYCSEPRLLFSKTVVVRYRISDGVALDSVVPLAANWSRSNFSSATSRYRRPSDYLGCTQRISSAVNDRIGIEPKP